MDFSALLAVASKNNVLNEKLVSEHVSACALLMFIFQVRGLGYFVCIFKTSTQFLVK